MKTLASGSGSHLDISERQISSWGKAGEEITPELNKSGPQGDPGESRLTP